ncbi:MAG: 30S ribosomal protein S17 [Chitinispirillales bacterium]|jgi:small subunit ribosomal protein S17|nr:30S ribosomal protein S17 [Chitinispirillales bacterium]
MAEERNKRKVKTGMVVSDKADKTITVSVQRQEVHPKYEKIIRVNKKYKAHDEKNESHVGDTVRIMETRPLSKTKRWRLVEIIEKAK